MEPPERAVKNGHDLVYDPPAAMSSAQRWTCRRCWRAVIKVGFNEYGSALEYLCDVVLLGDGDDF